MEVAEPPNYRRQPARFGPKCGGCESFDGGSSRCEKHGVPVEHFMTCDSWKRNKDLPIEVV